MADLTLRIGTRASPLALAQAKMADAAIRAANPWLDTIIVPMTASGDKIQDRPLAEVGGKALWTKELDRALIEREIDIAVHSMKDVETIRPAELSIIALLERADVRDRLIGVESVESLPVGATVGTASPRRSAQLLRLRPDLKIVLFRGNVATRLAKLENGEADATLLAAAGLDRLGMQATGHAIEVDVMLPAPAQGAVGIEALADRPDIHALIAPINHRPTFDCVMAERAFLAALKADCHSPVGALARIENGAVRLRGEILSEDGVLCESGEGSDPTRLAETLLERAAPALRAAFG